MWRAATEAIPIAVNISVQNSSGRQEMWKVMCVVVRGARTDRNCPVCQSAPFCCLSFCSTQFVPSSTRSNPKPDTLPHNVLLSTKWRNFSTVGHSASFIANDKWSCKLFPQQNYQQLISATVQICSCPSVHCKHCLSHFMTAGAVLYRNVDCNWNCFSCCTLHKSRHLSNWLQRILVSSL